jgi:uncharacterized protein HemY
VARREREWHSARDFFEQALAVYREARDRQNEGIVLNNIGGTALEEGDLAEAGRYYREALTIARDVSDRGGLAYLFDKMARLGGARGNSARAALLTGAAEALEETLGIATTESDFAVRENLLAEACARLGDDAVERLLADGRALPLGQAVSRAMEPEEEGLAT